jgi:CDP-glucose 4,6-dehydratase
VEDVVNLLIKNWEGPASWLQDSGEQPHEAHSLKLDCSKARQLLHWIPRLSLEQAIERVTMWHYGFQSDADMKDISLKQIWDFIEYSPASKDAVTKIA